MPKKRGILFTETFTSFMRRLKVELPRNDLLMLSEEQHLMAVEDIHVTGFERIRSIAIAEFLKNVVCWSGQLPAK